jgi:hypothetical protein
MSGNLFLKKSVEVIAVSFFIMILLSPELDTTNIAAASILTDSTAHFPPAAAALEDQIIAALNSNHDWVGMLSYGPNNATISYLGPGASNPYHVKSQTMHVITIPHSNSTSHSFGTAAPESQYPQNSLYPVVFGRAIMTDGNNNQIIYEELSTFKPVASSQTNVNLVYPLNGFDNNNNYVWMQVYPFYDEAQLFGPRQWYAGYDNFFFDCTENTAYFPVLHSFPHQVSAGDTLQSYIYGSTGGQGLYVLGSTDLNTGYGDAITITVNGDTATGQSALGRHSCSNGRSETAGGMIEEQSNGSGQGLSQQTIQYNYGFCDTSVNCDSQNPQTTAVGSWSSVTDGYAAGDTHSNPGASPSYQYYTSDPEIEVFAYDQSGNQINGLAASVYNSANQLIGSGYTPFSIAISTGGTYYVDYDNYGSYTLTSAGNYPGVTSYSINTSWGGQATLNVPSNSINSIVQVFGNYATDSCPTTTTCTITVNSKDTNFNTISGLYMQLYQGSTNIANGWTTVQFTGVGNSNTYTVYADNYCNSSTHQQFTFTRWGDGTTSNPDTLSSLQHDTTITAYYIIGSC